MQNIWDGHADIILKWTIVILNVQTQIPLVFSFCPAELIEIKLYPGGLSSTVWDMGNIQKFPGYFSSCFMGAGVA